jgi:hypothetical protein
MRADFEDIYRTFVPIPISSLAPASEEYPVATTNATNAMNTPNASNATATTNEINTTEIGFQPGKRRNRKKRRDAIDIPEILAMKLISSNFTKFKKIFYPAGGSPPKNFSECEISPLWVGPLDIRLIFGENEEFEVCGREGVSS